MNKISIQEIQGKLDYAIDLCRYEDNDKIKILYYNPGRNMFIIIKYGSNGDRDFYSEVASSKEAVIKYNTLTLD